MIEPLELNGVESSGVVTWRGPEGGAPITPGPRDFLRYSHLGVQFVIILIAFALGGAWLDERLSAGGLVTLAGVFAGAAIGFYILYREIPRK